ncbi:AAA family ATPase [Sunxiuqinia sp. A32]|uniref:AAA family ATPase n=1 Tax=Sunxiuqinia sp. A32 TaxID=3461496 RepID=UPI00404617D4
MSHEIRIAVTGPESTAKSTLSKQLADHFGGIFYPEYAREYLDGRKMSIYNYQDVENIVRGQLQQYQQSRAFDGKYVFFDTWLIITKVWFEWVYHKFPDWLEEEIANNPIDLYLLCLPDIEWKPDPLRENGGDERIKLFNRYKQELTLREECFMEVAGEGEDRLKCAINAIHQFEKVLK